ncbi:MAG: MBL fold metallo-hydrolase [Myxococcales bacterium]|jgi:glyoxylase-like metal-dependent hydrolase (beta-lactamase superfamily II)|nr:MBL fold metallo-hydrolase [Myxococcales bacterium]
MGLLLDKEIVGLLDVNAYLLFDDETARAVLVDPGGDLDRIEAMVHRRGAQVEAVVATHGHVDHVGGVAEACRRFQAPFWIHAMEASVLDSIPLQARLFGFPGAQKPEAQRWLNDGETFAIGHSQVCVIATPGHTPGGICLYAEAARLLLTGDTLFVGDVGRSDLPGGDGAQLARSIREKLYTLPAGISFYPGHGPSGSLDRERSTNPFVRS